MKLSVTSWSFPQCSFKEAVGLSSLLDINAIDISYFYRSALDKELLLKDYKQQPNGQGRQLPVYLKAKLTFYLNEKKKSKTRRSEDHYK